MKITIQSARLATRLPLTNSSRCICQKKDAFKEETDS
jgi:hypothetical protein